MLSVGKGISDLIFSPGRPPQVERHGELTAIPSLPVLQADDTAAIARDLVGKNDHALKTLKGTGRVRPLVLAGRTRPLSRQHLPAAGGRSRS
jgi:Tfp pilus assembly pilus retraction ATPase PilT